MDSEGFMPYGWCGDSAMLITMFSFMGAEATIAAAESDTPEKHIVRATNSVIGVFYLLFVLYFCRGGVDPVEYAGTESRWSYRSVLELLHIPMRN
ncbi:hypothetical protein ACNKHK_17150 [Shigella flexneri]